MADVKFSGIGVVAMNGSIGTTTFARNFYGTYAKTRIGAPAGSAFLTAWNATVGTLTAIWTGTLTDDQRSAWIKAKRRSKDCFGDAVSIRGFDLFMSTNLNLFLIGVAHVIIPPFNRLYLQIDEIALTSGLPNSLQYIILPNSLVECALYATPPLSPGRMSTNQIYGYITHVPADGIVHDMTAIYTARFSAPPSGKKVFIKVLPINPYAGLRGTPLFSSCIIS